MPTTTRLNFATTCSRYGRPGFLAVLLALAAPVPAKAGNDPVEPAAPVAVAGAGAGAGAGTGAAPATAAGSGAGAGTALALLLETNAPKPAVQTAIEQVADLVLSRLRTDPDLLDAIGGHTGGLWAIPAQPGGWRGRNLAVLQSQFLACAYAKADDARRCWRDVLHGDPRQLEGLEERIEEQLDDLMEEMLED
jgi:hypothetical protein